MFRNIYLVEIQNIVKYSSNCFVICNNPPTLVRKLLIELNRNDENSNYRVLELYFTNFCPVKDTLYLLLYNVVQNVVFIER